MKRCGLPLWLVVSFLFLASVFPAIGTGHPHPESQPAPVLRITDGKVLPLSRALEDLKAVQIVFVGELHDNPQHHRVQLAIITALHKAGATLAVGLEMFQENHQAILDQWVSGALEEKVFQKNYSQN